MIEPVSPVISGQLRAARDRLGGSRDEVAAACRELGAPPSFTAAALRNLESGRRPVTVDELVLLAAALQVPVQDLLGERADLFAPQASAGTDGDGQAMGQVEAATRDAVATLIDLDGPALALAESAYVLARQLDAGAGLAAAAVARQHQAALQALSEAAASSDDDDDDFGPE